MEFWAYRFLTLIVSTSILALAAVVAIIERFVTIFPLLFRMITVHRRRVFCFELDVTNTNELAKIKNHMRWVVRIIISTLCCLFWEALFLQAKNSRNPWVIQRLCETGYECFVSTNSEVPISQSIALRLIGDAVEICGDVLASEKADADTDVRRQRRVRKLAPSVLSTEQVAMCYCFFDVTLVEVMVVLAAGTALSTLFFLIYQSVAWIVWKDRTRMRAGLMLCWAVALFFFATWLLVVVLDYLRQGADWVSQYMVLAIPLVVWLGILTANNLRAATFKQLQAVVLGRHKQHREVQGRRHASEPPPPPVQEKDTGTAQGVTSMPSHLSKLTYFEETPHGEAAWKSTVSGALAADSGETYRRKESGALLAEETPTATTAPTSHVAASDQITGGVSEAPFTEMAEELDKIAGLFGKYLPQRRKSPESQRSFIEHKKSLVFGNGASMTGSETSELDARQSMKECSSAGVADHYSSNGSRFSLQRVFSPGKAFLKRKREPSGRHHAEKHLDGTVSER